MSIICNIFQFLPFSYRSVTTRFFRSIVNIIAYAPQLIWILINAYLITYCIYAYKHSGFEYISYYKQLDYKQWDVAWQVLMPYLGYKASIMILEGITSLFLIYAAGSKIDMGAIKLTIKNINTEVLTKSMELLEYNVGNKKRLFLIKYFYIPIHGLYLFIKTFPQTTMDSIAFVFWVCIFSWVGFDLIFGAILLIALFIPAVLNARHFIVLHNAADK